MCSEVSAAVRAWILLGFEDVLNRVELLYYKPKGSAIVSEYLLLLSSGVLRSPRTDRGSDIVKYVWPVSFANHGSPSNDDATDNTSQGQLSHC
jgi:hypothetical protein